MRIIRTCTLSTLAVLLFSGVAWSLVILFFQVVLSPVTRAERPLTAAFSPVHVGYEGLSVSLPKPGIPLEANRLQSIGGRDVAQWLRPQEDQKAATPVLDEVWGVGGTQPSLILREAPLLSPRPDFMLPMDSNTSMFVIVFVTIPTVHTVLCSP